MLRLGVCLDFRDRNPYSKKALSLKKNWEFPKIGDPNIVP